MYVDTVIFSLLVIISKQIHGQLAPNCNCVPRNQCYLSNVTVTDPQFDIRIVNQDSVPTSPPTQPCPAGMDVCCYGPTVVGCGLRSNISLTATTTPLPGQMRYGNQPWQLIIMGLDNTTVGGAVLLDAINVLTAAHKVINRPATSIKVRAGEWDLSRPVEPYPYQESLVASIRIHPNYTNMTNPNLLNDVAILRLTTPIVFNNPAINAACLPFPNLAFDGQRCLVAGWGKDAFNGLPQNTPKEVEVPVVPYADCQTRLRATRLGPNFNLDPNSFLCAGGEQGRDACTGDGGAALTCNVGGRYVVAGLVAWGVGCADNNVPGVYVKVSSFLPQLQQWLTT